MHIHIHTFVITIIHIYVHTFMDNNLVDQIFPERSKARQRGVYLQQWLQLRGTVERRKYSFRIGGLINICQPPSQLHITHSEINNFLLLGCGTVRIVHIILLYRSV